MANLSNVPFGRVMGRLMGPSVWMADEFRFWLQEVKDAIDRSAKRAGAGLSLTGQAAAVSETLHTPAQAGLFRVSWTLRVTQAATTSSSLAVSVGATSGGVLVTETGPALTTNTVGAVQSGSVVVSADAATAITAGIAYASVGATPMQFAVSMTVEALS